MDWVTGFWLILNVACLAVILGTKFKNVLPGFLNDLMVHGKTRPVHANLHWFRELLLVPNSWFRHFYALGLAWNILMLVVFFDFVYERIPSPDKHLRKDEANSRIACVSILLILFLLTIQLSRRFYESLFVTAFSGKMHLAHYVLGFVFYVSAIVTVVHEARAPPSRGWLKSCQQPAYNVSWLHIVAATLFVWASYHQYRCHTILGKLAAWTADNKKVYKVPHGDWFEYVSSPHYLAEILIYFALFLAMEGRSSRWGLVLSFVILNQVHCAQNTHKWYKQKFDDYPKERHIIIPYVY